MKILADENIHIGIVNELRKAGFEILFIPEVGLAGCNDQKILEYSERYDLILLSGDKDFGGLIEFGTLWGRGKVILLRYRLIIIDRIAKNIAEFYCARMENIQSLSYIEKLEVVDSILMHLDKLDSDIDRIWAKEARKRWQAYKSGKLETLFYEQVMEKYSDR